MKSTYLGLEIRTALTPKSSEEYLPGWDFCRQINHDFHALNRYRTCRIVAKQAKTAKLV